MESRHVQLLAKIADAEDGRLYYHPAAALVAELQWLRDQGMISLEADEDGFQYVTLSGEGD